MNVTKIILTRCQFCHLKCTQFNFGWGSAPDAVGGAHSAPQALICIWGREKGGGRRGGKSEGIGSGRKEERKGKGKGKGREGGVRKEGGRMIPGTRGIDASGMHHQNIFRTCDV